MKDKEKRERTEINEEAFFGFAKSYLSEAFPNPGRTGCPPDDALKRMAETPRETDAPISQHLTCCSPCFNRYMELLSELRRKRAG